MKPLHIHSPLIESAPLSSIATGCHEIGNGCSTADAVRCHNDDAGCRTENDVTGCRVWLKLDSTQPTSSFKIRGIGHHIQQEKARGRRRVVASSGGNAGLAAAYAARQLDMPCQVFVPGRTSQYMQDAIAAQGAAVVVHGSVWDHADARARQEASDPGVALIHPFDHPDIWAGHASLVQELVSDIPRKPDLLITVVGGGGLLAGLVQGLDDVGWQDVPVLAMETEGANCLHAAVRAGQPVTLPDITSIATTLGALRVVDRVWDLYTTRGGIISEVVTDRACVHACARFADDHRILVEPSCGAALAAVYDGVTSRLENAGRLGPLHDIVIIVCGGHAVTLAMLEKWKKMFDVE